MRVIGIVGRSFCGSTLLAKLLTLVPDAVSPGELHWLLDGGPLSSCRVCGRDCSVFTPEFRASLSHESLLYRQVARHLGVQTLISSDKTPWQYERFVQPQTMDGILLVRSPQGVTASELHREIYKPGEAIIRAVHSYVSFYALIHSWCREFCRRTVVVTYEDLCEKPQQTVDALCKSLELSVPALPSDLSEIAYHQLGGGEHTHATRAIALDERWKDTLTTGQQRYVNNHLIALGIYERLRALSVGRTET